MIRSMTGFATQSITLTREAAKTTLSLSIKSLNSRYFETTFKIMYPLSTLETELTKIIKERLVRGHVHFMIHISNPQFFKGSIEPALPVIEGYLKALHTIKEKFNLEGSPSVGTMLQLPNIFNSEEQMLTQEDRTAIFDAVGQLLNVLIAAQDQEGASLLTDIKKRIEIIKREITAVSEISLQVLEAQKAKIHQTLQELAIDESKFAEAQKNALYAMLDKIDTHEEVTRFNSHLESILAQLNSSDVEKGKRLDFTLQELAREINTITAKCSDARISKHAINIKVELEKAREQVQNIV